MGGRGLSVRQANPGEVPVIFFICRKESEARNKWQKFSLFGNYFLIILISTFVCYWLKKRFKNTNVHS